jgi:uncharacterized protein GlcG (DUF336 family)
VSPSNLEILPMNDGMIRCYAVLRAMSQPVAPYVDPELYRDGSDCRDSPTGPTAKTRGKGVLVLLASLAAALWVASAFAADLDADGPAGLESGAVAKACAGLPSHAELRSTLALARSQQNGGFDLDMWGAVVNRDGVVCAVAFTGTDRGRQWPGSRVIAAQKASTANAFSLPGLALSTANLWAAVQPGGSLYGLQESNPVDTRAAYAGPASAFGKPGDPLVGRRIGGINVFGGGLPLYDANKELVGALGVSGDTSCADHNIAWRTRRRLQLDWVPAGVGANGDDNINYRGIVAEPSMQGDFSHPVCKIAGVDGVSAISAGLPPTRK